MPRRFTGVLIAAGLQLVALVLAHELVYLARYGSLYGEALVHSGHGEAWASAVITSLVLGAVLAAAAALRLARLGIHVRRRAETNRQQLGSPIRTASLLRGWLRIGLRVATLTVVLLTVQENVERGALTGRPFNIAMLLAPEYAGGLWIATAVGLAVGLVAALFEWRQRVLLARLRAPRPAIPRSPAIAHRTPIDAERPIESLQGRRSALRAPPTAATT
jgi:hypothetical protein